jgi:translation elongation factor EF-Ts
VEGRLRKFYEEAVLLEQAFFMDAKVKIRNLIKSEAVALGMSI